MRRKPRQTRKGIETRVKNHPMFSRYRSQKTVSHAGNPGKPERELRPGKIKYRITGLLQCGRKPRQTRKGIETRIAIQAIFRLHFSGRKPRQTRKGIETRPFFCCVSQSGFSAGNPGKPERELRPPVSCFSRRPTYDPRRKPRQTRKGIETFRGCLAGQRRVNGRKPRQTRKGIETRRGGVRRASQIWNLKSQISAGQTRKEIETWMAQSSRAKESGVKPPQSTPERNGPQPGAIAYRRWRG